MAYLRDPRDRGLTISSTGHDPRPDRRRNRRARATAEHHDRRRPVPVVAAHSDAQPAKLRLARAARARDIDRVLIIARRAAPGEATVASRRLAGNDDMMPHQVRE